MTQTITLHEHTWQGLTPRIATIGDRVQLSPACDLWMQGATHGTIRQITPDGFAMVKMDHPQVKKLVKVHPHYLSISK